MKYSDFISLQDYFHPVFNLKDEASGYWEKFIPTRQFNELLEKTIDAVSSNIPQNRKSIWVQGTFGTGKSHAGAVVKHLFCDNLEDIEDYIKVRIKDHNLRTRLKSLRENRRYFPVVLSGVEGAYNPHTFSLTLQRTVKETLRKAGHQIRVKSDFETAIDLIENRAPYLQELINSTPEIQIMAKTKDGIVKKLKNFDMEFFLVLEGALQEKYSVQLSTRGITQWLSEVETEIRNNNIADGLLIFWDEFTSILDTISNGSINLLQEIAELSEKQNIYLYLISHRNVKAYGERAEEIRKMQDRFHIIQYNMEAITTYHIMSATIKKTNVNKNDIIVSYDEIRDAKMHKFDDLISYLTDNGPQEAKNDVKNLFPLHPYTSFLCSSIADHIGSANRSVFSFMYDDEHGFSGFLQDEEAFLQNRLLTAESLWDFFLDAFLNDPIKYGIITETYNAHRSKVKAQEASYAKVFKGVLLLNAMRNTFEKDQVLPSSENIKRLFSNEDFEDDIENILDFFDRNQIVQRDPSDNFLIAFSSLPVTEINEERNRTEVHYKDALQVLEFDPIHKMGLTKWFDDSLIRCGELCFMACSADEYLIRSRLNKEFKEPYSLHIALFFAMNEAERQSVLGTVKKLAIDEFPNTLFVVFAESLNEDSLQYQRFIDYVVTQTVAKRHNSNEQAQTNQKNANQIIHNWLNRLRQGNCTLFFNINEVTLTSSNLSRYINQNVIHKIFSSGFETLQSMRNRPLSFYKQQNSKKLAEVMLCAINRDDAEKKLTGPYTHAKFLFKDDDDNYIVGENFELKRDAPSHHPLVMLQLKVDELLDTARRTYSSTFNLGQVLQPLFDVPFGLYSNIPNVALLSFTLRKYQNELYEASLGVPLSSDNLRDKIIAFFKNGANTNKLNVRFGSKEEKELKDMLIAIFDLTKVPEVGALTSIKNVRWGIIHYCKNVAKHPLWCLKYINSSLDEVNNLIDQLVSLINSNNATIQQIRALLQSMKEYQHDFKLLLLSPNAFEKGFKNYINKIETVKIDESWWDELFTYFIEHLQKEIGFWTEADVASKSKDFYIKKISPVQTSSSSVPKPYPTTLPTPNIVAVTVPEEKVRKVRNKITEVNLSVSDLKRILVQIIDKFPETVDVIEENLDI